MTLADALEKWDAELARTISAITEELDNARQRKDYEDVSYLAGKKFAYKQCLTHLEGIQNGFYTRR